MEKEISAEAEQEAERRYPETQPYYKNRRLVSPEVVSLREAFEDGVEWQAERLGPLVEAARAYRDAPDDDDADWVEFWLTEAQSDTLMKRSWLRRLL